MMLKKHWPFFLILLALFILLGGYLFSFWPTVDVNTHDSSLAEMKHGLASDNKAVFRDNIVDVPEYERLKGISMAAQEQSMDDEGGIKVQGKVNFLTRTFKSNHHTIPFTYEKGQAVAAKDDHKNFNGLIQTVYADAKERQAIIRNDNADAIRLALPIFLILIFGIINLKYAREIINFSTRLWYKNLEPSEFSIFVGKAASVVMIIFAFILLFSHINQHFY